MPNIEKESVFINDDSFLSTRYSNDDRPKSITKLKCIIGVYILYILSKIF